MYNRYAGYSPRSIRDNLFLYRRNPLPGYHNQTEGKVRNYIVIRQRNQSLFCRVSEACLFPPLPVPVCCP